MNKKGSLELGMNSIVIIVIAITILGIILGIIVPMLRDTEIPKPPDCQPNTASSATPVSVCDNINIQSNKKQNVVLSVYNPTSAAITLTSTNIVVECKGITPITVEAFDKTIQPGTVEQITITMGIPSTAIGEKLCQISTNSLEAKQFNLNVK